MWNINYIFKRGVGNYQIRIHSITALTLEKFPPQQHKNRGKDIVYGEKKNTGKSIVYGEKKI